MKFCTQKVHWKRQQNTQKILDPTLLSKISYHAFYLPRWMKFTNYLDKNVLQIIIVIPEFCHDLLSQQNNSQFQCQW